MFFVATKLFEFAFQPVTFLVLAGLLGLALRLTRFARLGQGLAAAAALIFAVFCYSPLTALMLRPLEDRFPQPPPDMPAPTGIVVLGGALDEGLSAARGKPTLNEAASRLTSGVALAHRYPEARLVFTGGTAELGPHALDEARGVRALWLLLGVPEARMAFESASRNTYENATLTKALVAPQPGETWLLVTSAAHMPRSIGIFREVGWPVVAYPVDYRTYGDVRDWRPVAQPIDSLRRLDVAAHEWIGLLAYRLTGRTSALFPAP